MKDRIALVTGASAGIGEACAVAIADAGGSVVLNARRQERLEALASRLGRAAVCAGDCADDAVIDAMFETARSAFGRDPDIVIVNAGRGLSGSVVTSDPASWEEMIRTNLLGAARLMRAAAHRLDALDQPRRDVVVLGSNVGRHISPFSSMYGSTKFAVNALAEAMRRELAPKNIRVTLVEPGFVVSEFQGVAGYDDEWFRGVLDRIGPVLEPEDVARTIRFALEQPAHVHLGDILIRPTRQDYP
ncbi:MAG: SDR family oxidoreductase [Phycisphaerales bacterium]|nr:SDR family oxidoreductase [Phycisphaerales bacterium]